MFGSRVETEPAAGKDENNPGNRTVYHAALSSSFRFSL